MGWIHVITLEHKSTQRYCLAYTCTFLGTPQYSRRRVCRLDSLLLLLVACLAKVDHVLAKADTTPQYLSRVAKAWLTQVSEAGKACTSIGTPIGKAFSTPTACQWATLGVDETHDIYTYMAYPASQVLVRLRNGIGKTFYAACIPHGTTVPLRRRVTATGVMWSIPVWGTPGASIFAWGGST